MLTLYALAHPIPNDIASPIVDGPSTLAPFSFSSAACTDINSCRTLGTIVWACVSVIFLCTWVAIHPNVPKYQEHTMTVVSNGAVMMFMAFIAPELIGLWAMRQWYSAQKIYARFKRYGWSKTHAFFVLMGGFALYEGDEFCRFLWESWNEDDKKLVEEIERLRGVSEESEVKMGETKIPPEPVDKRYTCLLEYLVDNRHVHITEAEIQDKSHADVISKTITVFQTSWFIVQCIARSIEGLAITELEIITLAFAFLNFIICFLWWNKPLRVRYPVRVTWHADKRPPICDNYSDVASLSWQARAQAKLDLVISALTPHWHFDMGEFLRILFRLAILPISSLGQLLLKFIEILTGRNSEDGSSLFSSRLAKDPVSVHITCYLIAVAFGALHCAAWGFEFPSESQQLQWRTMSLLVTFLPLAIGFFHASFRDGEREHNLPGCIVDTFAFIMFVLCFISAIAYIAARVWLVTIAVIALRHLPPSAFQAVRWTYFLPHIG
ncbi:hypothetical protein Moror_6233 [Moniliophthora roreri MCA 2997]|uniref:Uncharacterized protein n=2 Tax=Moniliophthora roreri TaxID=221103 RepID=V2WS86_MONRO|nr:hypothetical protein Moror_6233 [Moniliophthora roreri MCA 2997]KAI3621544.1 hypothetical protein WG66_017055 [Moniliophthora roreri]